MGEKGRTRPPLQLELALPVGDDQWAVVAIRAMLLRVMAWTESEEELKRWLDS